MSEIGSSSSLVRLPAWPLRAAGKAWRGLVDALLPGQCMLCNLEVDEPGRICADYWPSLSFIAAPFCPCCGTPFAVAVPDGLVWAPACASRRALPGRPPSSSTMAAAANWCCVQARRPHRSGARAGRSHATGRAELLSQCDLIAPVPLHPRRLWRRRFNQSGLLAQALAKLSGRPVQLDLLQRRKFTRSLGHAGRQERRRILAGAIAVNPKAGANIRGRRILLIDDVLTTGATAPACCRALLRAGAAAVDVLTLARVVRPE